MRKSRVITDVEKKMLLALKPTDISYTLAQDLFGVHATKTKRTVMVNGKPTTKEQIVVEEPKMIPPDRFILKKGEYFNKEDIETTVGLFLFNKLLIEPNLQEAVGYVNHTLRAGDLGDITDKITKAFINDKTTTIEKKYKNDLEWLGMRWHALLCSSFTPKTFKPIPEVTKERDKLYEENREAVERGDAITVNKIENALIAKAKEHLKGDPGLMLYDSGARGSFANNYKNMCITKGVVYNPITGKNDVVEKGFMEGIDKKSLASIGNSIVAGAYPKAIGTAVSGYYTKQLYAALQAASIDPTLLDCGATTGIPVKITKENKKDFNERYVIDKGKLVFLDDKTIDKYVGKVVEIRSIMTCTRDKYCKVCAGRYWEKVDIINLGLTATKVTGTMTNLSMKKFHDTSIKIAEVDINDITL